MKIIGTADWHAGIHTDDVNGSRAQELEAAVFLMAAEDPDLLVVAGDLFHHNHPSVDTVLFVQRLLKRFDRVLLIPGNHGWSYTGRSPVALLAGENVQVIERIDTATYGGVLILCVPPAANPDEAFATISVEDLNAVDLLVGHWAPKGMHGIESTFFAPDPLAPSSVEPYTGPKLLGHFHSMKASNEKEIAPGSPLRLDFGDDPDKPKGYWLINADTGKKKFDFEFKEVPSRQYVTIDYKNGMQFPDVSDAVVRLRVPERTDAGRIVTKLYDMGAFHVRSPEVTRATRRPRSADIKKGMPHADAVKTYCKLHEVSAPVQKRAVEILQGGTK